MSNSSLVNYTLISPNSDSRLNEIKKITIHHMAGNLSVEDCGRVFQNKNREASAHYGVDTNGRVGQYVDEGRRAWSTASPSNDHQAINIEVADDGSSPEWHVSDKAISKLIDLCTDICKRNGINSLNYTGDANGNLTRHNMFMATACPGPYLQGKFSYISEQVNKNLNNFTEKVQEERNDAPKNLSNEEAIDVKLRMLRRGMSGPDVHAAMVLMKDLGYYDGDCDDLFGPRMESGLERMQADHNLGVDGIFGNASWTFVLTHK